jgi:hypothetical protein
MMQRVKENAIACAASQKGNLCRLFLRQLNKRSFERSEEQLDTLEKGVEETRAGLGHQKPTHLGNQVPLGRS